MTRPVGTTAGVFAIAMSLAMGASVVQAASKAKATSDAKTFALSDTKDLVLVNVKAEAVEYKGRKAVRITKEKNAASSDFDGFALLKGTDFQDGTIEAAIALKITRPREASGRARKAMPTKPGIRTNPGFAVRSAATGPEPRFHACGYPFAGLGNRLTQPG